MSTGQLWAARDRRRSGHHRVLWVSPCQQYARVIRTGSNRGRYVKATNFMRRYRHHAS